MVDDENRLAPPQRNRLSAERLWIVAMAVTAGICAAFVGG